MKKMKLELDSLRVQSFATDAARSPRGTVRAHGDALVDSSEEEIPGGGSELGLCTFDGCYSKDSCMVICPTKPPVCIQVQ
jgi:hypothetical protein